MKLYKKPLQHVRIATASNYKWPIGMACVTDASSLHCTHPLRMYHRVSLEKREKTRLQRALSLFIITNCRNNSLNSKLGKLPDPGRSQPLNQLPRCIILRYLIKINKVMCLLISFLLFWLHPHKLICESIDVFLLITSNISRILGKQYKVLKQ